MVDVGRNGGESRFLNHSDGTFLKGIFPIKEHDLFVFNEDFGDALVAWAHGIGILEMPLF